MRRFLNLSVLVLFAFAAVGCKHVVTIDSEPPGAEIKVNGEKLGKAPVSYTETTGWDKSYSMEANLPGYATTRRTVTQTEWHTTMMIGSIAGGVCAGLVIFPIGFAGLAGLLFAKQMPDRVVLSLEKGGSTGGGGAPADDYGYDVEPVDALKY
jgi:hypothetical protein